MTNLQISELLKRVAASYQLKDQNKYRFQIMAYERAADSVEHATSELKDLWDDNKLGEVPGIGESITKHLDEIFKTGKSKHFESVMKGIPEEAFILMALPKVGIKTAVKMMAELPKKELNEKIAEAKKITTKNKRTLLPYGLEIAEQVVEWMKKNSNLDKIEVLGSVRRKVATVGDIDILVCSKKGDSQTNKVLISHFTKYPKAQKTIEAGIHTASILLPADIQVDILVCDPEAFGNALQHFTGSKMHNIKLREYALKRSYSMSEYGIKHLKNKKDNLKKFKTEESLYNFLKMDYIEPELREDTGEIEAATDRKLPKVISLEDVRGDLQIHSNFDIETSHDVGASSISELVKKAKSLNYEYIAFTEHNPSKKGHTPEQVIKLLRKKTDWLREKDWGIKIFNSLEVDINKDGTLPVPDEGLNLLDFALVSIHSGFDLNRDEMTNRVLEALKHPKVKIFAHPTARKIQEREGVELDWPKIFDFCKKNNKWIEINADPMRLDLPDSLVKDAVLAGVTLTLGTDTHEASMMDNMKYGVWVARRGWCQKKDIVNTLNLSDIEKML